MPERLDDPFTDFMSHLGIEPLADVVARGALAETVGPEAEAVYVRFACLRWDGPPAEEHGMAALHFASLLVGAISMDSPDSVEVDGVPYLLTERGPIELTEEAMRHWWWAWTVLTDEVTARRLIAAAPEEARAEAREQVERVWRLAFDSMTEGQV
jgi:hypothetical protein